MGRSTPENGARRTNLFFLVIFGVAFGFVEAAVVYYLHALMHFHQNYSIAHYKVLLNLGFITFVAPLHTLLINHRVSDIEVARESATVVMLACVAFMVGRSWKQRAGALLVSFACWDLTYYLFLRILDNWPKTLFTKDVYFLIPVTWIGPVITPLALSLVILIVGVKLYVD